MSNVLPQTDPFYPGIDNAFEGPLPPAHQSRQASQGDVHWKIATIEKKDTKFQNFTLRGQMPVTEEGITMSMNQVIPEAASAGQFHPFIQWLRGELNMINIPVLFYSRDNVEDIKSMFVTARRLMMDMGYGRIPICRFTYGDIISVKCLVKGFGEVRFGRPKTTGQAKRIDFSLTLARYIPYDLADGDTFSNVVHESRMQVVSDERRMYEFLARYEWGTDAALYGDRLRKRNRAEPFAVPDGEATKVPSGKIILNETVTPEYHGFNMDREVVSEMINDKFTARNTRVLVV